MKPWLLNADDRMSLGLSFNRSWMSECMIHSPIPMSRNKLGISLICAFISLRFYYLFSEMTYFSEFSSREHSVKLRFEIFSQRIKSLMYQRVTNTNINTTKNQPFCYFYARIVEKTVTRFRKKSEIQNPRNGIWNLGSGMTLTTRYNCFNQPFN